MKESWRCLARVSGALATRDPRRIRQEIEIAAAACEVDELEEILLQSYLFLGYPAALGGLAIWRELSGRDASLSQDEPGNDWSKRGEALCRRVYGTQYEALRKNVAALHPSLDRWMVTEGYGRVLGRPGVPFEVREMSIVALLAVLDAPAQLYSHLRGALAVGVTAAELDEVLQGVEDLMPAATWERARAAWTKVTSR